MIKHTYLWVPCFPNTATVWSEFVFRENIQLENALQSRIIGIVPVVRKAHALQRHRFKIGKLAAMVSDSTGDLGQLGAEGKPATAVNTTMWMTMMLITRNVSTCVDGYGGLDLFEFQCTYIYMYVCTNDHGEEYAKRGIGDEVPRIFQIGSWRTQQNQIHGWGFTLAGGTIHTPKQMP